MKRFILFLIVISFNLLNLFAQEAGITNPADGLIIHRYNFDTYITETRTCTFDGWANAGNIDIRLYVNGSRKSFDCNNCGTWNITQDIDAGTNSIYIESRKDFDPWVASSHRSITFMKPLNSSDFYLTNPDDTFIKITWFKHTSEGTEGFHYRVYRNTVDEVNSGDDWVVLGEWAQNNTYSDYFVEIGTTYFYWIVCASDNSGSNPSAFGTSRQTDSPFPVELTTFTAKVINNSIALNWETATEINNYGFDLERRHDVSDWGKIAFIPGHGNSNSPKTYEYIYVDSLSGILQYRLKQIDTDGSYEYYGTIPEVDFGVVRVENFTLPLEYELHQNYPNPFNPVTDIHYDLPKEGHVTIRVFDIQGRIIKILINKFQMPGSYHVHFDGTGISAGIYFYRIKTENYSEVCKMLLLK